MPSGQPHILSARISSGDAYIQVFIMFLTSSRVPSLQTLGFNGSVIDLHHFKICTNFQNLPCQVDTYWNHRTHEDSRSSPRSCSHTLGSPLPCCCHCTCTEDEDHCWQFTKSNTFFQRLLTFLGRQLFTLRRSNGGSIRVLLSWQRHLEEKEWFIKVR